MRARKLLGLCAFIGACSGGDDNNNNNNNGQDAGNNDNAKTSLVFEVDDACSAKFPTPTDLFKDDDLRLESPCPTDLSPADTAIAALVADEGASLEAKITIPVEGDVSVATLTATAAFDLTATIAPSALPPVLVFLEVGNATTAAGWRAIPATAAVEGGAIVVTPSEALGEAGRYRVVLTDAVRGAKGPLEVSSAAKGLWGTQTLSDAKLERERQRLLPIVDRLVAAGLDRAHITSLQGFTTHLGFHRFEQAVARQDEAIAAGRIALHAEKIELIGKADFQKIYGATGRPEDQQKVRGFVRGTISVPKFLDEMGHLRSAWDDGQTVALEFLAALPDKVETISTTVLYLPGYHRSRLDVRALANAFAGGPNAVLVGIDLPGQGSRSADMVDVGPNGNPEISEDTPDGIPDRSGEAYLPGEPRAFRDSVIAETLEIRHVLLTLAKTKTADGLEFGVDSRDMHVIAHGLSAPLAVYAAAFFPDLQTLSLPASGGDALTLASTGPEPVRTAFMASVPGAPMIATYVEKLRPALDSIDFQVAAGRVKARMVQTVNDVSRVLLPHGGIAEFVPVAARTALVTALGLKNASVPEYSQACDDYMLYTCTLGDGADWLPEAKLQLATFVSTKGFTVRPPP